MNPLALLAALRAHAAAGGPGSDSGSGPPPPGLGGLLGGAPGVAGPPPGTAPPSNGGDFPSIVQKMIQLGVQAQQAAPDAVDASGMAKIVATLHQFAASAQQDKDQAMGVSPAIRAMRRNSAAQAQG